MCIFQCLRFIVSFFSKTFSVKLKKAHLLIVFQSLSVVIISLINKQNNSAQFNSLTLLYISLLYLLVSMILFFYRKYFSKQEIILITGENAYSDIEDYVENNNPIIEQIDINQNFLPEVTMKNKIKMAIYLFLFSIITPMLSDIFSILPYKESIYNKYDELVCCSFFIFLLYSKKKNPNIKQKCLTMIIFYLSLIPYFIVGKKNLLHGVSKIVYFCSYGVQSIFYHYYLNRKYVNFSVICMFQSFAFLFVFIICFLSKISFYKPIISDKLYLRILGGIFIISENILNVFSIKELEPGNNIISIVIKSFLFKEDQTESYLKIIGIICVFLFNHIISFDLTWICKKKEEENFPLAYQPNDSKDFIDVK